jgi:hypothetical protein
VLLPVSGYCLVLPYFRNGISEGVHAAKVVLLSLV